ncbi:MAG: Ig-like domain-containing protein, partial [Thermoanaerobaculales bacterium]
LVGPNGNDNQIPFLILDGGPPQIVSIVPPPGMEDVSRTAAVEIVFSEPLFGAVLPQGVSSSPYFELIGPGGSAAGLWTSGFDNSGRQTVIFTPSAPYANQAYYSLKIKGGPGGVRDRVERLLTPSGDVGSSFKTSDSIGPEVVGSVPSLDRPAEGEAPIRYDFNEALTATDEQLDGIGDDDAAVLSWGKDDGGGGVIWQPLPVSMFLTRSSYSLTVDPANGLDLTGDNLLRRIQISGLVDGQGNPMAPFERQYRIWDGNPPVIDDLPPPPGAPGGQLVPGTAYTVTPVLSGIDNFPLDPPQGDLDRVEYFFDDPTAPGGPTQPNVISSSPPYELTFVAAYSGDGVNPKPLPVWARAVDTSTNESNVVELAMEVLPNQGPTVGAVTAIAVSPVAGVLYAGSEIAATVEGMSDPDGTQLALAVQLFEEGGALLDAAPTLSINRPPSGDWGDLTAPTVSLEIPIIQPEGAQLHLSVQVTDSSGASAVAESARFPVADDQGPPVVESISARSGIDGEPRALFHIGEQLYLEFIARDAETEVIGAEAVFDRPDIFSSPLAATRISGNLYRTETLTVPHGVFSETTQVTATISADDRGGNFGGRTLVIEVAPEPDPTAPTVEWLTPWEGAPWPAAYTSVLHPTEGVALLLRVAAHDLNLDDGGNPVPGTIVSVEFRGPVSDGLGGVELAADPVPGTEAPGEGVYELVWQVPNQIAAASEVPFEVRVVDSGNLDVVRTVRMQAQVFRKVYEIG